MFGKYVKRLSKRGLEIVYWVVIEIFVNFIMNFFS